jgi:hypothetical protein
MTVPADNQVQAQDNKAADKELNFRRQEAYYKKMLDDKDKENQMLARELEQRRASQQEEEDTDSEPYVDNKKLNKKFAKFGEQTMKQTQNEIKQAVQAALRDERQSNWLKNNSDFYDVMQHAEKFHAHDPELAETILEMPESFERSKLVYKNIKALGLHKPPVKESPIQEKIDSNRRNAIYQPGNVGAAPYQQVGDFSEQGQQSAYKKMMEQKARLRI